MDYLQKLEKKKKKKEMKRKKAGLFTLNDGSTINIFDDKNNNDFEKHGPKYDDEQYIYNGICYTNSEHTRNLFALMDSQNNTVFEYSKSFDKKIHVSITRNNLKMNNFDVYHSIAFKEQHLSKSIIKKIVQWTNNNGQNILELLLQNGTKELVDYYFTHLTTFPFSQVRGGLFLTCKHNNLGFVITMLNNKLCNIDDNNNNVLDYVLSLSHDLSQYQNIIIFLIRKGAKIPPYVRCRYTSYTFLSYASVYGNVPIANELLKSSTVNINGMQNSTWTNNNKTALYYAIENDNINIAHALLDDDRINVHIGQNSLKIAFEKNYHTIVNKLIMKGCAQFNPNISILTCALLTKNNDLIQSLLDNGQNIHNSMKELSDQDKTPIIKSCIEKYNLDKNILGYSFLINNNIYEFMEKFDDFNLDKLLPQELKYSSLFDTILHKLGSILYLTDVNDKKLVELLVQKILTFMPNASVPYMLKLSILSQLLEEEYITEDENNSIHTQIMDTTSKNSLFKELQKTKKKISDCFACMMQESTHFNNECGHMMFCDECANVAQNQYNVKQCPSCRVPIKKLFKLYD